MTTVIVGALLVLGLLYVVPPMAARSLYRRQFRKRIARSGLVCLTFDDGPDPATTMRILDCLATAGVRATFFVTGRDASDHPEIVRRLLAERHELGEHSFSHTNPMTTDPLRSARDVLAGARTLRRLTGADGSTLFRPPYGKLNLVTLLFVVLFKKRLAFWTIDPRDYERKSSDDIVRHVAERVAPGSVILLHDGRQNAANGAEVTLAAVAGILQVLKDKGLKTAVVSEALRRADEAVESGKQR